MVLCIAFVFLFHSLKKKNLDIPLALTLESTFAKPKELTGLSKYM